MEKWSVTEQNIKGFRDGEPTFIVHLIADTVDDIPEPQENWMPGSTVQIAEPHGYRILDHEGVWK